MASGSLLGDVRDESGAVAPGVTVTALHNGTGFTRSAVSDSQGAYRLDELLPGAYTVTAAKAGFRTVSARNVTVEVNQKARLDLVLKVGPSGTASSSPLRFRRCKATTLPVGYRLDTPEITSLPLVQRNIVGLITLGPGAIPRHLGGFSHDIITDVQGNRGAVALNPSINGGRSYMNTFLLDGATDTDRNTFAIAVLPPLESVQEFRIQSSLPSAEFAQAVGGVVDVVTKSGALAYHGSAFEYFRNEALDARSFFDDPTLPRPDLPPEPVRRLARRTASRAQYIFLRDV